MVIVVLHQGSGNPHGPSWTPKWTLRGWYWGTLADQRPSRVPSRSKLIIFRQRACLHMWLCACVCVFVDNKFLVPEMATFNLWRHLINWLINWLSGATNWKWSFCELKIGCPQTHTHKHAHTHARTKSHMEAGTLPKNEHKLKYEEDLKNEDNFLPTYLQIYWACHYSTQACLLL